MRDAPAILAARICIQPMVPLPVISTCLPSIAPARCAECSATDKGSLIAISSSDTSLLTGTHWRCGITKYSLNMPCMWGKTLALPRKRILLHRFSRPSRQPAQLPHGRDGLTAIRSPTLTVVTPVPMPATVPDASCPGVSGSRIMKLPTLP